MTAKITGYITRRQVEVGNWVQPGQPLMMLVPLETSQLWVQANYKETELTHVYLGQPATVKIDTYPGVEFKGRVDSIMAGTGSAFSLLPPENATGNWVKVVQRIPVKVALLPPFPDNRPLRIGMSTEVTIDTRERTGQRLLTGGHRPGGHQISRGAGVLARRVELRKRPGRAGVSPALQVSGCRQPPPCPGIRVGTNHLPLGRAVGRAPVPLFLLVPRWLNP